MISSAAADSTEALNEALFEACERGHLKDVQELLARGADVHPRGPFFTTPLMRAASNGHAHVVEELASKGADVNATSWQGETALIEAASWSPDAEVLTVLLDHKAEIDASDDDGWTALMSAAGRCRLDMVTLLVARGAQIDVVNTRGLNALGLAAEKNHGPVVKFLRDHGAVYDVHAAAAVGDMKELRRYASAGGNLSIREKEYGRSLLWMAAHNGHLDTVRWLLERGLDTETRGPNGETALHTAAESGHRRVVGALLDGGADIHAFSEGMGGTALHIACLFKHPTTAELLLDRGCGLEDRTKAWGTTALMVASESGEAETVRLLVRRGAKVNAVDDKGQTALMKAAGTLDPETTRILLGAGADTSQTDEEYQFTALHHACCTEECPEVAVRIADLLIRTGARVDQTDEDGLSPLDCAASAGCNDLTAVLLAGAPGVRLSRVHLDRALLLCASEGGFSESVASRLIEAGACVDCKDSEGYSPLMHAVELGDTRAVRFFLENGADPSVRNAEDETALDMAEQGGRVEIIEVLSSHRPN